jgi:hypothetical protein
MSTLWSLRNFYECTPESGFATLEDGDPPAKGENCDRNRNPSGLLGN